MILHKGEVVDILTTQETDMAQWGTVDQSSSMSEWVITDLDPEGSSGFIAMRARRDAQGQIDAINPVSGGTFDPKENTVVQHEPIEIVPDEVIHTAFINGYRANLPASRERMATIAGEQSYAEYSVRRIARDV